MLIIATLTLLAASPLAEDAELEVAATAVACPEASWVSFSPAAPFDPAVADVAALVWLPNLLFPCPSLFLGVGQASLKASLPPGGSAGGVALGHSVFIACCGLPLASTIIGLPLVALETMWVAPVSVLNALDRDVRCARQARARVPPSPTPPTPAPKAQTAPPRRPSGPSRPCPAGLAPTSRTSVTLRP